ncbi:MAG: PilZ domain-containing protein [Myxococcales bacterium]|nr:PilZ domain-containing protein [Myxococcales bacterium]
MAYLGFERRSNRRVDVPATATVVRAGATVGRFIVANLSAAGALLIGDSELGRGDSALLRLESPGCPPVVVLARIVRGGTGEGVNALAVEFRHRRPDTEDAIQDVVLSALEADHRSRRFAALDASV